MNQPSPCPLCGAGQFLLLDKLHFALKREVPGTSGSRPVTGFWRANLMICTGCARTEIFTTNGRDLAQNVPEARFVGQ